MSNSLTSLEDLTPYIQQLARLSNTASNEMERQRSFASDPDTLIKDLLTEVMSCRKSVKQACSIAGKFFEAYQTSVEEQNKLLQKNSLIIEDINELNAKIQKYEKEIEIKDNRYDNIAMEATDMERVLKVLNAECTSLQKERDFLKNEILKKEQTNMVRENIIQQRQKFIVEVEKEKEKDSDKQLQGKYDRLLAENKKKQLEIEILNSRLSEEENIVNIEKAASEKIKVSLQQLRNENSILKSEIEEMNKNLSSQKDKFKRCQNDLLQQKSMNESLIKEYDRQRGNSVTSVPRESVEIPEEITSFIKSAPNKPESLGMYMEELETSGSQNADNPFFIISSPTKQDSPKFILTQNKKICKGEEIAVQSRKSQIELQKILGFTWAATLDIEKSEGISVIKIPTFQFDDDVASVVSSETEASSKLRRGSFVENKDPIKQFFIFV